MHFRNDMQEQLLIAKCVHINELLYCNSMETVDCGKPDYSDDGTMKSVHGG